MKNAVLVSAVRTPVGKRGGVFKTIQRMDLLCIHPIQLTKRIGAFFQRTLGRFQMS